MFGFGRANNQGMDIACGRFVLLLNTDAFVAPDTLAATLSAMEAHPDWVSSAFALSPWTAPTSLPAAISHALEHVP